jgi:hypothetical protein
VSCRIRVVDLESAKKRLKSNKRYQEREPFRMAVASLTPEKVIELAPEGGESLRKLKLDLARAAKEVGRNIAYGETTDDKLIAWLAKANGKGQRRRVGRMVSGAHAVAAAPRAHQSTTTTASDGQQRASDPLAVALARGEQAKREILAEQGEMLGAEEVARRLGRTLAEVEARRRRGLLIALPDEHGQQRFPAWQFADRDLLPGLEVVLTSLPTESPWGRLLFLRNGDPYFGGQSPLELLRRGEIEPVRRLAAAYDELVAT